MVISILSCTQIVFEGIRGTDYTGDIAIDDVSITAGICQGTSGTVLAGFSECILIFDISSLNFRFVLHSLSSVGDETLITKAVIEIKDHVHLKHLQCNVDRYPRWIPSIDSR